MSGLETPRMACCKIEYLRATRQLLRPRHQLQHNSASNNIAHITITTYNQLAPITNTNTTKREKTTPTVWKTQKSYGRSPAKKTALACLVAEDDVSAVRAPQ